MILKMPITNENDILYVHAGDIVYITGVIYTARDAASKRLDDLIKEGKDLPIDLLNQGIYYVGPTPAKPGEVIGSCGTTYSYRMDVYMEGLMKKGLKVMIGKGPRSEEYKELLKKYKGLYLSCIGGCGCLIKDSVKKCDLVCYDDLGCEAIYRLEVEDLYTICTYDAYGNDLFLNGQIKWSGK